MAVGRRSGARDGGGLAAQKADLAVKDEAAARLAVYGEAFLSMFEDDGGVNAVSAKGHKQHKRARIGPNHGASAQDEQDERCPRMNKKQKKSQKLAVLPSAAAGATPPQAHGKQSRRYSQAAAQRAAPALEQSAGDEPQPGPSSPLEEFLFSGRRGSGSVLAATSVAGAAGKRGAHGGGGSKQLHHGGGSQTGPGRQDQTKPGAEDQSQYMEQQMRKQFMSPKASLGGGDAAQAHNIFAEVEPPSTSTAGDSAGGQDSDALTLDPQELQRIQWEVERLGGSALTKKDRKAWRAAMLSRLGAKPDKAPRMAASIGRGMAIKQGQREAKALEEALLSGMAKRKGLGKKKRAEQAKQHDYGLQEAGPGFRQGVLRLKLKANRGDHTGGAGAGNRGAGPPGSTNPGRQRGKGKGKGGKGKGKGKGGKGKKSAGKKGRR